MNLSVTAHGKFLLTGEYLVLEGVRALAIPLKLGQQLEFSTLAGTPNRLYWQSFEYDRCWFSAELDLPSFSIIQATDTSVSERLRDIFLEIQKLNPDFINPGDSYRVNIRSDFNLQWGLGSSSTLIYSLARWAGVNPYLLLENTFGGSGYDLACAGSDSALFYTRNGITPRVEPVRWQPPYADQLFFVYLGVKMNSRTGMAYFREHARYGAVLLHRVSAIGDAWVRASTVEELESLITEHESLISALLDLPTVKEERFPDYPYAIKSLGAWGGDFVLATGRNAGEVRQYFRSKGLETLFSFSEIVLG